MNYTLNEHNFTSHDGQSIHFYHWSPETAAITKKDNKSKPKKTIVMFHRGHEHGLRMKHIVEELGVTDFDWFAWDARGHGKTPGERGYAPDFGYFVRDVEAFFEHLEKNFGVVKSETIVIAQSVGAVIASAWVHDYAPKIRGLILASPAFDVKLYIPGAVPGLKILHKIKGDFKVNSYVKSNYLTHDKSRQESYDTDPMITNPISVNILTELYDVADRVVKDAAAIRVPTLLLVSNSDYVVNTKPQIKFFKHLGSDFKRMEPLDGFFHDTLGERKRQIAFAHINTFIDTVFKSKMWQAKQLLEADKYGYTYQEFKELSSKLPTISLKGMYYGASKAILGGIGGKLSNGLKVGIKTGFDSGSMLDVVYENNPQGSTKIGQFIDKEYLNAIGWQGIRQRKENLKELILNSIQEVRDRGEKVNLIDIASGHGRYILEALQKANLTTGDRILLRDYSQINVDSGTKLIETLGLSEWVEFKLGDAFDRKDLSSLEPKFNIAVVSGLYELFPENSMVLNSLKGLFSATTNNGILIYTGQPWHPQLEYIARVLTSHRNGADWIMRRRTQLEMDELVNEAGFTKTTGIADRWGIFTVSKAKK